MARAETTKIVTGSAWMSSSTMAAGTNTSSHSSLGFSMAAI
jgi:hypothetical protein